MNHIDQSMLQLRDSFELDRIVSGWLEAFEDALNSSNEVAVATMLTDDSSWRDVLAFTWHLLPRTGPKNIVKGLLERPPGGLKQKALKLIPIERRRGA